MKKKLWSLLLVSLITACLPGRSTVSSTPTVLSNLPPPAVEITHAPDAKTAAQAFLSAWQGAQFEQMYAMLTPVTRDAVTLENFTNRYKETNNNLGLINFDVEVLSIMTNPLSAQVKYRVNFHTSLVGDLQREMIMNLALENGNWMVQWEDGLILPELQGGNHLAIDVQAPARGSIKDINGNLIAAEADVVALGIIPSQMVADQEGTVLRELSNLTGRSTEDIRALYGDSAPDWYIPVGEAAAQAVTDRMNVLSNLSGLVLRDYTARYYFDGGIAPHATGYVLSITQEELDAYRRKGYQGSEKVGASGLEKWGEEYLAGKRGASLYVVDPNGAIITRLAMTESQPSDTIVTTINKDFQLDVQKAIAGFRGAAIVMERDTGRILAIVSTPEFDPNLFEPNNYNSGFLINDLFNSEGRPLLNRATQSSYPLGSVFKLVTMAAALESGRFTAQSTYDCQYFFTELPLPTPLHDWTYDYENTAPSGLLTLPMGLVRSCNPYFWHIGLDLYRNNMPKAVTDMARGFGLGKATGIGQLPEDEGNISDPTTEGDAVQMAIGQGAMLVTPLQVVDYIAALGNGGNLLKPTLVERIDGPDGNPTYSFKPELRNTLPVKPENLKIIQDAMLLVTTHERAPARRVFAGLNIAVHGKTGSATNPNGDAHAWFGGYTNTGRTDKPDIAAVVLVENVGEGRDFAAPIFRRIVEIYFDGSAERLYPWESRLNVTVTPTDLYTHTPRPADTETPTPEP